MLVKDREPFLYEGTPWFKTVGLSLSDFRSKEKCVPLTRALFKEYTNAKNLNKDYTPIFTVSEFDQEHRYKGKEIYSYSLYRLFLEHADPTEYLFAESVLGSYDHWVKISKSTFLKNDILKWRADLETKLKALGVQSLKYKAQLGDTNAAKFLSSKEWRKTYEESGRPSKERVKGQIKQMAEDDIETQKELERVMNAESNVVSFKTSVNEK